MLPIHHPREQCLHPPRNSVCIRPAYDRSRAKPNGAQPAQHLRLSLWYTSTSELE
ncbi:hypothetical protein RHMOL_Rhmol01G0199800 [Rhododendron molle]|uniref:Uncharacterized protein n=1 Tax=Rhododendron molle TaxID=49168 RepID=A0ACC0Q4T4_RHOML|nr:hypothetical protein RHMOL_Rhmol01G0199800 [Rhododendron molle]